MLSVSGGVSTVREQRIAPPYASAFCEQTDTRSLVQAVRRKAASASIEGSDAMEPRVHFEGTGQLALWAVGSLTPVRAPQAARVRPDQPVGLPMPVNA